MRNTLLKTLGLALILLAVTDRTNAQEAGNPAALAPQPQSTATDLANRTKEFPEYHCKVVLPAESFVWLDASRIPHALAAWRESSGTTLQLLVTKYPAGLKLNPQGFDDGMCSPGVTSKISSENITFRGVPGYQLHVRFDKTGAIATVRAFVANGYGYQILVTGSSLPVAQRGQLEPLFAAFDFSAAPALPEAKIITSGLMPGGSTGDTATYFVGNMTFAVPKTWQTGKTNTPATKLFLFIPDDKGGSRAIIKVDVGVPAAEGLAANAKGMETRFNGQSTPILDGSVILTSTASGSIKTPRHIFTALLDGRIYFVFVAADSSDIADEACAIIRKTMKVAALAPAAAGPTPVGAGPANSGKETVTFDGQTLIFAFQGENPGESLKEYIPQGETLTSWTRLASIREYPKLNDPMAVVANLVSFLKQQNPKAPSKTMQNSVTGEVVVDFVTWTNEFAEFNVFKYAKKPGGGLIAQQYAVREYKDQIGFLKNLRPLRERLVDLMMKEGLQIGDHAPVATAMPAAVRPKPQRPTPPVAAAPVTAAPDGSNTVRTRLLGFGLASKGSQEFSHQPGAGGMLIGFNVGFGKFINTPVIHALQPIYRTPTGEVTGPQYGKFNNGQAAIKAKPGYAVSGITVKAGLGIDGFSVTFMRIKGAALDPADTYTSDWLGGKGGGKETPIGGQGTPVVGIYGRLNSQQALCALGLALAGSAPENGGAEKP